MYMGKNKRLFDVFVPEHYDIFLDVNREHKTISGVYTITGEAKANQIQLNQKYLTVEDVTVDGKKVEFNYNDKDELITISSDKIGKIKLVVTYNAKLTDTMMGIYPSYYEVDGVKKQLVGTQFETTFARQAFPCVDEPEAKATFNLAVKYDEKDGETIISNEPEFKCENGIHYFKETVRMSTYLVAFVFGDMQKKLTKTKSGVEIGVFATKAHKANELDFALDIAKRSIEFYEDFYGTPYPLEHSYQVALPDFSAGAMENWGCVTYREAYLLVDPDNTSLDIKQLVATVIAHELAHQWFGDLVTMKWWDNLWLNESFANMMEYVAVDALESSWKIWETFQTMETAAALRRDATDGVQSVHIMVNDPAEIDSIFDSAIVYAKGARLLVMVRALLGDDALRQGLKNYFAEYKYGNAQGQDLWEYLGQASGLNIGDIMDSWLEQPGYPVVRAGIEDGNLVLSQKQFFIGTGEDQGRLWQIPLNSNYLQVPKIMKDEKMIIGNYEELRAKNGVAFRLNVGNNSHFIVKYDQQLLDDILSEMDHLNNIDKLQLLQDLGLLAESQEISYADVLPLLVKEAESTSNIVNSKLYGTLAKIKIFATPDSAEETSIKQFSKQLSESNSERLGVEPHAEESIDDNLTRPLILSASLYGDNPVIIAKLHELYLANKDKLADLNSDIRYFVLLNEIKNLENEDLFKMLFDKYAKEVDQNYKRDICLALTSVKNPDLLQLLIDKFKDASVIKPQDLLRWVAGILRNNHGQQKAWDWMRQEWQWLDKTVGGDMSFTAYISVVASTFDTPERLAEFKEFFDPKINVSGLTREIKMDTLVIENKVALIAKDKVAVNKAIKALLG